MGGGLVEREEPDTFLGEDNIGGKWGEGWAGRQEPHPPCVGGEILAANERSQAEDDTGFWIEDLEYLVKDRGGVIDRR